MLKLMTDHMPQNVPFSRQFFCDKHGKIVRKSTAMLVKHFGVQKCVFCYTVTQVTLNVKFKLVMLYLMTLLPHILFRLDKIPVNL